MTTRLIVALCVTMALAIGGCGEPTASEPTTPQAVQAPKAPETPAPAGPAKAPAAAETAKAPETPKPAEAPKPAPTTPATPVPTPQEAAPMVFRVNCGAAESYTDKAGNVWAADQEWQTGKTWGADGGMTVDREGVGIIGTDAPRVYETERYSMYSYKFTVPNGKYTVRLHFCETFEGILAAGERVFSVSVEGQGVLKDLDIFKEVGPLKPLVKEFKGVAVADGQLTIEFTPNIENPEINGIEIMPE